MKIIIYYRGCRESTALFYEQQGQKRRPQVYSFKQAAILKTHLRPPHHLWHRKHDPLSVDFRRCPTGPLSVEIRENIFLSGSWKRSPRVPFWRWSRTKDPLPTANKANDALMRKLGGTFLFDTQPLELVPNTLKSRRGSLS